MKPFIDLLNDWIERQDLADEGKAVLREALRTATEAHNMAVATMMGKAHDSSYSQGWQDGYEFGHCEGVNEGWRDGNATLLKNMNKKKKHRKKSRKNR